MAVLRALCFLLFLAPAWGADPPAPRIVFLTAWCWTADDATVMAHEAAYTYVATLTRYIAEERCMYVQPAPAFAIERVGGIVRDGKGLWQVWKVGLIVGAGKLVEAYVWAEVSAIDA